jgi:hypothetical protein
LGLEFISHVKESPSTGVTPGKTGAMLRRFGKRLREALEDPRLSVLLRDEGKRGLPGPEKALRQGPKMQKRPLKSGLGSRGGTGRL